MLPRRGLAPAVAFEQGGAFDERNVRRRSIRSFLGGRPRRQQGEPGAERATRKIKDAAQAGHMDLERLARAGKGKYITNLGEVNERYLTLRR